MEHPLSRAGFASEGYSVFNLRLSTVDCQLASPRLSSPALRNFASSVFGDTPNFSEALNTLTWTAPLKPDTDVQQVHAQMDLDLPKFTTMFVGLMKAPPQKK